MNKFVHADCMDVMHEYPDNVEQEKLYVVTDGNKLYLKEFDELNAIIIITFFFHLIVIDWIWKFLEVNYLGEDN
ncbi:hypothetical protein ODU26_05315, partial [Streptococcus suis]